MPKRCALGCSNKNIYHRFPHPEKNPDCFKAWVHIVGGKLDSPADYELYRKKVICDIHFTDKDRNRYKRLNFLAVPSLHLPGKSDKASTTEKVFLAPEPVIEESILTALKPTLAGKSDEAGTSEKVFLAPEPVIEESILTALKPTLAENSARIIRSEHNYCQLQKKGTNKNKSNNKQQEVPSFWLNQLKTTRRKMKLFQSNLMRSQKRNQNLAYYFTNALNKAKLKELLKKIVLYVQSTGYFETTTIHVIIYSWCRSINRILSGKITYDGEDELKTAAQIYKNKHKHSINK